MVEPTTGFWKGVGIQWPWWLFLLLLILIGETIRPQYVKKSKLAKNEKIQPPHV